MPGVVLLSRRMAATRKARVRQAEVGRLCDQAASSILVCAWLGLMVEIFCHEAIAQRKILGHNRATIQTKEIMNMGIKGIFTVAGIAGALALAGCKSGEGHSRHATAEL